MVQGQRTWLIALDGGDDVEILERDPPPTRHDAYSQLVWCIRTSALKCMAWLLKRYPGIANMGNWQESKPLEHCVSSFRPLDRGKHMSAMALMLLEAGAEPEERFGFGNSLRQLFTWRRDYEDAYVQETALHLIDYGAWVSPMSLEMEHLRPYHEKRRAQVSARLAAARALWIALRKKRMPRDVINLVIRSTLLSDVLSWKEWNVK